MERICEMLQEALHTTLEDFYKTSLFRKYERYNYKPCLAAFEAYCTKTYPEYSLKELFENAICMDDIIQSGKLYFTTSEKASSKEAIDRFLSAMDFFYKHDLKKMGIQCNCMEDGCRHNEISERIELALGEKLKKKTYHPITAEEEERVNTLADSLDDTKFYTYGQKIIYRLLLRYGFKPGYVIEMKKADIDLENNTLRVQNGRYEAIYLCVSEELTFMFKKYMDMQPYKESKYLFTTSKGKKLKKNAVFISLQDKIVAAGMHNISSIPIALRGVEKLLGEGLLVSEIVRLTGFSVNTIANVADYMLRDVDVSKSINEKI